MLACRPSPTTPAAVITKPDWNNLDTLLLDMDGTLLDLHFDNQFWLELVPKRWGELNGFEPDEAKQQLFPRFAKNQGSLNWYCLDYWSHQLQLPVAELKREIAHLIGFLPGAEAFLGTARKQGKQLVLMTNAHRASLQLKIEITGLDQYFDHLLSAHDFGLAKEEHGFWNTLQQQLNFNPATTLMIDDSSAVLHTAAAHGLQVVQSLKPDSKKPANSAADYYGVADLTELQR